MIVKANFLIFQVQDLISNTQLNISSEEKVFTAVLNWVKNDLSERKKHIASLFANVRLPLLNREFLMENVETEPLIRENCKELLLEAMKYHLLPEQRSSLVSQRTLERKPEGMKPYVFAVGGGTCALLWLRRALNISCFVISQEVFSRFTMNVKCTILRPTIGRQLLR